MGGGNGAHAAAADLTLRGFTVNMYEDERFAPNMQQVFGTKKIELSGAAGTGTAELAMVTSDLAAAIEGVKVILVAVPAFAHAAYAEKLAEVVTAGQIVLVLPGTFGSLMFWKAFKAHGVEGVCVAESTHPAVRHPPARPRRLAGHEPLRPAEGGRHARLPHRRGHRGA